MPPARRGSRWSAWIALLERAAHRSQGRPVMRHVLGSSVCIMVRTCAFKTFRPSDICAGRSGTVAAQTAGSGLTRLRVGGPAGMDARKNGAGSAVILKDAGMLNAACNGVLGRADPCWSPLMGGGGILRGHGWGIFGWPPGVGPRHHRCSGERHAESMPPPSFSVKTCYVTNEVAGARRTCRPGAPACFWLESRRPVTGSGDSSSNLHGDECRCRMWKSWTGGRRHPPGKMSVAPLLVRYSR